MNPDQNIIIIAGPNGAGKTTFAREFLPQEAGCLTFINADLIAQGLSPFRPEEAAIRASRLMLEMIGECVKRGESFAIETTLSGRSYARMIPPDYRAPSWPSREWPIGWPRVGTTFRNP